LLGCNDQRYACNDKNSAAAVSLLVSHEALQAALNEISLNNESLQASNDALQANNNSFPFCNGHCRKTTPIAGEQ
jgi:hypothetical protein